MSKAGATEVRECVCGREFEVVTEFAKPWTVCRDCMLGDFHGPDIQPGDLVSVEIDGVLHTDYYQPGKYQPAPRLSLWRRGIRRLTPPRWRKPLPVGNEPLARAQARTAKTLELVERLTTEPKVPWWHRWMEGMKR